MSDHEDEDIFISDGSHSDSESETTSLMDWVREIEKMLLVADMWNIPESKFTRSLLTSVEQLKVDGACLISEVLHNGDPEFTWSADAWIYRYHELAEEFDKLKDIVQNLSG